MSKFIGLLFLLIGYQSTEESIPWTENYSLEWKDFKGSPNYTSEAAAVTASGLTFGFSAKTTSTRLVEFDASVEAHFYPKKSWYRKHIVDDIILAHEQLHFDITELHARKLRKLIKESKFSINIKEEISKLHSDINKELASIQKKYDTESDFSRSRLLQNKWQVYISTELKKLSKYK